MDKIKEQANKVSGLVFSSETGTTYQKTLTLTWKILRETGILVWLVVCLSFVGVEWFYRRSVQLGRSARVWYSDWKEKGDAPESASFSSVGQAALESVQSSTSFLLAKARQQLGLKEPPPAPAVTKPQPAPTPAPTAVAAPVPPVADPTPVKDDDDDDDMTDDGEA